MGPTLFKGQIFILDKITTSLGTKGLLKHKARHFHNKSPASRRLRLPTFG